MAAGQFRAFSALIVAVMFGVVQIVCACLPDVETSGSLDATVASASVSHHGHISQSAETIDLANLQIAPSPMPKGHCDPDGETPGPTADCAHCDGASLTASAIDVPSATLTLTKKPDVTPVAAVLPAPKRAGMAATNLAGLRWRDPPRSSPVKLQNITLI